MKQMLMQARTTFNYIKTVVIIYMMQLSAKNSI
jgi:hypothetical protein